MSSSSSSSGAPPEGSSKSAFERGQILYFEKQCDSCHAEDGTGIRGRANRSLVQCNSNPQLHVAARCDNVTALASYIHSSMPPGEAFKCDGDCAQDIAAFVGKQMIGISIDVTCTDGIQKGSPSRRLNKLELANTINDVFGIGGEEFDKLESDATTRGFATVGYSLDASFSWGKNYINVATNVAEKIIDNNAFNHNCAEENGSCIANTLADVGKRLYRRALNDGEKQRLAEVYNDVLLETKEAKDGEKAALLSMLLSPKFLFVGTDSNKDTGGSLSQRELAERISLSLTASLPDDRLITAAEEGKLNGARLDTEIDRILNNMDYDRFAEFFVSPWLGTNFAGNKFDPEKNGIAKEDWEALMADMKKETKLFISHIVKNNLPVSEILSADYSFLNARLKRHYGIDVNNNNNEQFELTRYPSDMPRRGLMTQGSFLAFAAETEGVSYVDRGKTVLAALACQDLEPEGDVAQAAANQALEATTEKEKMAARAANGVCSSCHERIDPIGWVFTQFGVDGKEIFQDPDGDQLDTSGTLFGKDFEDARGLAQVMIDEGALESCLSSRFLVHTIGRDVIYEASNEDRCAIDTVIDQTQVDGQVGTRDLFKSLLKAEIATTNGTILE